MASLAARLGALLTKLVIVLLFNTGATAQPANTVSPAVPDKAVAKGIVKAPRVVATPVASASANAWSELSPLQQQALKPLAANWSHIDEAQKRKWLSLSRNFGNMPQAEQAKLHSRMTEWVALSPRQRSQARLNFAETKKLSPDEKVTKWQAYQTLNPEEKRKLAASAPSKPKGAATAVKPVPAQKLVTPPDLKAPRSAASAPSAVSRQVDRKTLLPRSPGSAPRS